MNRNPPRCFVRNFAVGPRGIVFLAAILLALPAWSQGFESGSNEEDGSLTLDEPGPLIFDPQSFDPPLDGDGDGVYHFSTITISEGVEVLLRPELVGYRPVVWLATGDVEIHGTLDLSGEDGMGLDTAGQSTYARPGPGGFQGGAPGSGSMPASPGAGPGGGQGRGNAAGGGAGHAATGGTFGGGHSIGGPAYGNALLRPLLGGSGGGGGSGQAGSTGGGGGAGGGAILIASSIRISVAGAINADGGKGGRGSQYGGGGSGGAIRLVTPILEGGGSLSAASGRGGHPADQSNAGSPGRLSLETLDNQYTGTLVGVSRVSTILRPPLGEPPLTSQIRLVAIDGVPVVEPTNGHYPPADVTIQSAGLVTLDLEAMNVPVGTQIEITMIPDGDAPITVVSQPLDGTDALSTTTAEVTIPAGFSRFTMQASWTP